MKDQEARAKIEELEDKIKKLEYELKRNTTIYGEGFHSFFNDCRPNASIVSVVKWIMDEMEIELVKQPAITKIVKIVKDTSPPPHTDAPETDDTQA